MKVVFHEAFRSSYCSDPAAKDGRIDAVLDLIKNHVELVEASPAERTEVIFDFSLGAERYRVARSPEQERPKRRGPGTTTEAKQATLWRRTGLGDAAEEGMVLASRCSTVSEEVERLLGFSNDQFRQVVLLPQGEFRKLLVADSREREAILEVLFQTRFYKAVEEALREAAKEFADQASRLAVDEYGCRARTQAAQKTPAG